MKPFNVLHRDLNLHQNYLLEASAGTGKTFSIQNVVLRLLIDEESPISLDEILVVTFTRAATRDLKLRIRVNLEEVLSSIQGWLNGAQLQPQTPDYLQALIEKGESSLKSAKKQLQRALFDFDQAQIFTIHSFCGRMLKQGILESDLGLHVNAGEEVLPDGEILEIVKDYLCTEIDDDAFSPAQLREILKNDQNQSNLINLIRQPRDIADLPDFRSHYAEFCQIMRKFKNVFKINSEALMADFQTLLSYYKAHRKYSRGDAIQKVQEFAKQFDQESWSSTDFDLLLREDFAWTLALAPSLQTKPIPEGINLHYPGLTKVFQTELEPLLRKASDGNALLARLAAGAKAHFKRYQGEEERFSPDDLLKKMEKALLQSSFVEQIQNKYRAAIIDEFQDTDPLQWNLFKTLFSPQDRKWKGNLYLVGDPKQSIYSFRQADIYTYLAAADLVGKGSTFSLDVNYRSHPKLIDALNTLFSSQNLSTFIPLPKAQSSLKYSPVAASDRCLEPLVEDGRGAVHFFIAERESDKDEKREVIEEEVFLPFIMREIETLKEKNQLGYSSFAILVRDRRQAARLSASLRKRGIPYQDQRGLSLVNTPAWSAAAGLMAAVLHPRDLGKMKLLLGGPLVGFTHPELAEEVNLEMMAGLLHGLRHILVQEGLAALIEAFLRTCWKDNGKTCLESLLQRDEGLEIYRDFRQITDLLIDRQYKGWNSPEGILPFMASLKELDEDEEAALKRAYDPEEAGVKILTLHSSKGLEFDIVFALGLASACKVLDRCIPFEINGIVQLIPVDVSSSAYLKYCEELDSEKMRQLYVALTRAKRRIYIPALSKLHKAAVGGASPMELFISRFDPEYGQGLDFYHNIEKYSIKPLLELIDRLGKEGNITYSKDAVVSLEPLSLKKGGTLPVLNLPQTPNLQWNPIDTTSFTAMTKTVAGHALDDEEIKMPSDYQCVLKTPHTLPASAETGVVLHTLFEKVNFSDFRALSQPQEAKEILAQWIFNKRYGDWDSPLAEILFHTLKVPLLDGGSSFCLADLEEDQIYREMPFLFPHEESLEIEGIERAAGLIKGVIDLIFVHQGKYYIVDWKTNWLGGDVTAYDRTQMEKAMHQHHYFLQAKIYCEALRRYLHVVEKKDFKDLFGGVYYLFLRGIASGHRYGIFHIGEG